MDSLFRTAISSSGRRFLFLCFFPFLEVAWPVSSISSKEFALIVFCSIQPCSTPSTSSTSTLTQRPLLSPKIVRIVPFGSLPIASASSCGPRSNFASVASSPAFPPENSSAKDSWGVAIRNSIKIKFERTFLRTRCAEFGETYRSAVALRNEIDLLSTEHLEKNFELSMRYKLYV